MRLKHFGENADMDSGNVSGEDKTIDGKNQITQRQSPIPCKRSAAVYIPLEHMHDYFIISIRHNYTVNMNH